MGIPFPRVWISPARAPAPQTLIQPAHTPLRIPPSPRERRCPPAALLARLARPSAAVTRQADFPGFEQ
jgi:hypothetical protein